MATPGRGPASNPYVGYRADVHVCIGPTICMMLGVSVIPVGSAEPLVVTSHHSDGADEEVEWRIVELLVAVIRLLLLPCLPVS